MEAGTDRSRAKTVAAWRLLIWILIPSVILLLSASAIYTLWTNNQLRIHKINETTHSKADKEIVSTFARNPVKSQEDESVLIPDITEPTEEVLTDSIDEKGGNITEEDIVANEDVSFVDRLITNFQENSNNKASPHQSLSVKQFTSLGETGYRKIPNGHKYGEYQAISTISKYLERSTTVLPVSPTLPSFQPKGLPTPTEPPFNYSDSVCHSPQLSMCRGVIPWDLTTIPSLPGISTMESLHDAMPYFELILESGCSPRAQAFLCSLLEPECQPPGKDIIPPCRKACLVVAEDCNDFILDLLDLSKVFKCDDYPDSDNPAVCVNFARGERCLPKELRCDDGNCIPKRWRCNGIKDCTNATDEVNCTVCNKNQFTCESKDNCIPLEWKCDGNADCLDESDENDCQSEEEMVMHSHTSPCPAGELRCVDGRCITVQQICNGNKDCSDGADEVNCRLPFT